MQDIVTAAARAVLGDRGMYPFVLLHGAWNASVALLRDLSWRRRRVVVRRRRLVACFLLAFGLAGWAWGGSLAGWAGGSRLAGNGRLRGQIVVRPPVGSGAVRSAAVRLVPVAPAGRLAGLLFVLGAPAPAVVAPDVDHAGRWSTVRPVPGWGYAVVVEAEGCAARLAGLQTAFWLRSVRVDYLVASCRLPEAVSQWSVGGRSALFSGA